jgi:hypothetical protein
MLHENLAEAVEERAVYHIPVDNGIPKINCKTRPVGSHGWSPGEQMALRKRAYISQTNLHRAQSVSSRAHPACLTISLTARFLHD